MKSTSPPAFTSSGWLRRLGPVVLVPVGCFVGLILTYATNIPWFDDIDAFVSSLLHYRQTDTTAEVLQELIRPNNEHRILLGKLLMVSLFELTDALNFRWLILVALGFLLVIPVVLFRVFGAMKLPVVVFLPVVLVVLQPQYHLTSVWAVTGLQHEVSLALEVVVIYVLASRQHYPVGLGMQVLASLSMSSGLFGWVAGAGVLLLQKRGWGLLGWLLTGGLTIWLYFHDAASAQGNESSLSFFVRAPYLVIAGFFTFLGGLFDFLPDAPIFLRSIVPTVAGLGLVGLLVGWLWRMNGPIIMSLFRSAPPLPDPNGGLAQRRFFFTGMYLLLLLNAVVIAFLRVRMAYGVMLVGNYMIYPALLVSLLYLNGLSECQAMSQPVLLRRWAVAGLVVGGLVWGLSYTVNWPRLALRRETLLAYAYNQQHTGYGLGGIIGSPFGERLRRELDTLANQHIYHFPTFFDPYQPLLIPNRQPVVIDPTLRFVVLPGPGGYTVVATGGSFAPGGVWVVARSERHVCLFPVGSSFQAGAFWLGRARLSAQAEVIAAMLPPGTYRLGVLTTGPAGSVRFSPQTVTRPELVSSAN